MTEQIANVTTTTLASAITSGQTTLVVAPASGFPASGNFRILIDLEILIVTNVVSTLWTVTRGGESTTAAAHSAGATVRNILTAGGLAQAISEVVVTQRPAVAVGSTDPTTTSPTAVAIANPTITITTTGGDVMVWARMAINCSVSAVVNLYVRESVANTFVLIGEVSPPSSSGRQTVSGFHLFTGLSAGSHTFDLGMATSAGTLTSYGSGTGRRLMALEIKK